MAVREPAEPVRRTALPAPWWRRFSLVWLLPVAAVVFALVVLWQSIAGRGPLVSIGFAEAGGVIAGETRIRRNEVDVGTVEAVRLADDLNSVVVEARMDPLVEPYLGANTRFWIVNAQVNTTEISGLSTLLSGAYIGVDWDEDPGRVRRRVPGSGGSAADRSRHRRAPCHGVRRRGGLHPWSARRCSSARSRSDEWSADGCRTMPARCCSTCSSRRPYHDFLYPESRFYNVTGLDGYIDADGVSVRVESIAAFFTGGMAFVNPDVLAGLESLPDDGSRFTLHAGRRQALETFVQGEEDERFRYKRRLFGVGQGG